jgi:hypothetical protein
MASIPNIHEYAANLRMKPLAVRQAIQIGLALGITIFIALMAFGVTLLSAPKTVSGEKKETDSPFGIIKQSFSGVFSSTEASFKSIGDSNQ